MLRRLLAHDGVRHQAQGLASSALEAATGTLGLESSVLRQACASYAAPFRGTSFFFSSRKGEAPPAEEVQRGRQAGSQTGPAGGEAGPEEVAAEKEGLEASQRGQPVEEPAAASAAASAAGSSEEVAAMREEVEELRSDRLRVLADMENLRQRTNKAVDNSKQFAIQGFAKDLLEVADNLERAMESVAEEASSGKDKSGAELSRERALELLRSFQAGVALTDKTLLQVFKRNGVAKYTPKPGDAFDPSLHTALFDVPDPSKEAGQIALVLKTGYTLNGRIIRSAEVGTVRPQ